MEPSFLTIVIVAVLIPLIIPLAYCCFAFVKDLMPSTKRQITSKKHKDVYQSKKSTQRSLIARRRTSASPTLVRLSSRLWRSTLLCFLMMSAL